MFYKYRGVSELRYFLEIFVNNRLYAGPYTDLNDPMEGLYRYSAGVLSGEQLSAIKGEKEKIGILSLSSQPNNQLMWSHYSDGHKGIVIGVDIDDQKYEVRPIRYEGLSSITINPTNGPAEMALNILSRKLDIWSYEEEVRVFTINSRFVNVDISEVIFGCKMKKDDTKFFEKLISKINPNIRFRQSPINAT